MPALHHGDGHPLAGAYPELIVTRLLLETLGATRRALSLAHPQMADDEAVLLGDHADRLAFVLALSMLDLEQLVDAYHSAVTSQYRLAQTAQLDLPF